MGIAPELDEPEAVAGSGPFAIGSFVAGSLALSGRESLASCGAAELGGEADAVEFGGAFSRGSLELSGRELPLRGSDAELEEGGVALVRGTLGGALWQCEAVNERTASASARLGVNRNRAP